MKFKPKALLLISMLLSGALFGAASYFIIIPFYSYSLIHCLLMGIIFGLANYVISYQIYKKYDLLKKSNELLLVDVKTDRLTGLLNRRTFDIVIKEINSDQSYAMLFIDIDNFRMYNNQYGHSIGDKVLKKVCSSIKFNLRMDDYVFRYGGEEVIVLLKNCSKEAAFEISEKLRLYISKMDNTPYPPITISIGLACFPEDSNQIIEVVQMCDQALLTAKNQGKNRTYIYSK